ncbi:MAG: hypothetical protein RL077_3378 [Verrucomicrobiota bacterium]|jgi:hypothetical protein
MTAGRLLYLGYHAPLAALERSWREGGPLNQWITGRGRLAMRAAAARLPPFPTPPASAPRLIFLTGKKFWYQTAFCAASLQRHSPCPLAFEFIDDDSFDDDLTTEIQRLFPSSVITTAASAIAHLDRVLPAAHFPTLRSQRVTYRHLRKLTDAHAGRTGPRLVLDSDMLCFRRPEALLTWLKQPARPIHLLDVQDAYGYPAASLAELAGAPVPSLVNVGVLGLRSESIDWAKVEMAATTLIGRHGTSYYLEQALAALLLAGQSTQPLPVADYRLLPSESECIAPTAILHHYVAESKRGYFRHAWRSLR